MAGHIQRAAMVARSAISVALLLLLFLKAALPAVLLTVASAAAEPGKVLVPICSGGVILYVEMDLFGTDEGDPPDALEEPAEGPEGDVVAAIDCAIFGAFVEPAPSAVPAEAVALGQGAVWPVLAAPLLREARYSRPLTRGPPLSS